MASTTVITITHGKEAAKTVSDLFAKSPSDPKTQASYIEGFFSDIACGARNAKFDVQVNGGTSVVASATATYSTFSTAGDTIVINGVTFTAVASGATGNQFNVAASAALQAANVAAAINASVTPLVVGVVVASVVGAVVTVSASSAGPLGNSVTLTGTGAAQTLSGVRLAGGVATTPNVYRLGV